LPGIIEWNDKNNYQDTDRPIHGESKDFGRGISSLLLRVLRSWQSQFWQRLFPEEREREEMSERECGGRTD
jgi:hypothetical protein